MMSTMYAELAERYERGTLFFEMGRYFEAARELEPIIDAAPEHLAARLLLARAYFHSAQLGRAEAATREVIARAPADAYAHLMLGRTLQRQNRHAEAAGPLQIAAAMDPTLAA
ncbi:MAG TPA: tetratricopeptide repeat protein [Acidothermaceae bacterium]|jgi:tetratricopeptide (TPR) repeat protein